MANTTNQDPWVKTHRELLKSDPEYSKYVKKHSRGVNKIVRRYMLKSSFKSLGMMIILGGLAIGLLHLAYTYMTSDADILEYIIGQHGIDQMVVALLKVLGFSVFMPVLVAIGIFVVYSGLKNDRNMKKLDYATRMVEGYKLGVDPAKMSRPKRY